MPWLTIILTILSFFASKKAGASNTQALLTAGLVGAGTYYTTHETEWGRVNLGDLDGVDLAGATPGGVVTDSDGNTVTVGGQPVRSGGGNVWDTLGQWGGYGTAAVIGATGAATGSGIFSSKNLPWLLGGAFLVLVALK